MNVKPSQFDLISKLLDASALRHQVISQNVANVNTPGYKRQEVSFEDQLVQQLGNQVDGPVEGLQAEVRQTPGLVERVDGNNVDIDREMGALNKNAMLYQTYAQILVSKMATMRSAITGQP